MAELRLGDIIDDYCTQCRLLTNHSIVSMVKGEPVKVHCRTCFFEHNYRQAKVVTKKSTKKAQLFNEVLSSITGAPAAPEETEAKRSRKRSG
jgi:hypothetical protein